MLVRAGAKVVITDINEKAGAEAAVQCGATFLPHDVTDESQWKSIVARTSQDHGGLHVLVNNAGIGECRAGSSPESTTVEDWNRVLAVNATGVFLGCKHAIPAMRDSGGGSIINLSSIAALVATPFLTAYGASKAAVRQLTMSVAIHCAEQRNGVRCNSIHPGQIRTPMLEGLFRDLGATAGVAPEAMEQEFLAKIPLGEFGRPEDVAWAVLYLASDESRHVTGAQFVIDGGMQVHL
jgi:3(or 17)beta-hydroxysteroid dehydrogenase